MNSSNKKNIVLIPGLLCDSALWHNQIPVLEEAGYSVFVADITNASTITDLAQNVLGQAPKEFVLMGLSMGGYVCLEIMRQAQERVEKLIISNSSARQDSEQTKRRRRGLIQLAGMGKFKGVTPKLLPLLLHESRLDDEELTQLIMDMAERVGRDAFERQQKAILSRIDSVPHLEEIKTPTLIIGGDSDAITPSSHALEMADKIKGAECHIFEICGHLAPLEYPNKFNQIMKNFL